MLNKMEKSCRVYLRIIQSSTILCVYSLVIIILELATTTEANLTELATTTEANLTELATTTEANLTELATTTEANLTELATTTEANLTELATTTEANLTELATTTEANITELATTTEATLTELASTTEATLTELTTAIEANLTELATTTEANLTELATTTEANLTELATTTEANITELATTTEANLTELATTTEANLTELATTTEATLTELTTATEANLTELATTTEASLTELATTTEATLTELATATEANLTTMTSQVMKETNTKENLTIVTTLKTFETTPKPRLKNVETTSKPKLERETMVLEDPVIRGPWSVEAGSNATWTCQTNATFENSSDVSVTWYVDGLPDERATYARTSLGDIPAINFSVPLYTVNCELSIRTPTLEEAGWNKTMQVECRAWHVGLGNDTYLVAVRNVTLVTPQFSADHFNTTTNGTSEASPRDNDIEANDSYENLTGAAADEHTNFNTSGLNDLSLTNASRQYVRTKRDSTEKGKNTVWLGLIGALGGVVVLSTIVLLGMYCRKDPVFDRSLAKNSLQLWHRRHSTRSQSSALGLGPAGQGAGHPEAPNATQGDMFRAVYGAPRSSEWSGEEGDPPEPEPVRSEWNRRDSEDSSASTQSEGSSESDLSEQTESADVLEEQGHPTGH